MTPPDKTTLIEGVDYTVENGRWVFTAAFHLKRGHCCGSGCRHCPYSPLGKSEQTKTGDDAKSTTARVGVSVSERR